VSAEILAAAAAGSTADIVCLFETKNENSWQPKKKNCTVW